LCGSSASGAVSNRHTYYKCNGKRSRKNTFIPHGERVSIHREDLDQKVWDGLVYLMDDPARLEEQLQKRLEKKINPANSTAPDDKLNKELEKLDCQEKRIIDAYRESVISLDELKEQKAKIASNRTVLEAKTKASKSQQESARTPEITMEMLGDVSARYHRVMPNADFATREKLVKFLINSVTLYPNKAIVEGIIPVTSLDALVTSNHQTTRVNHDRWEKRAGKWR
jgi:site-specific DNA recombinase